MDAPLTGELAPPCVLTCVVRRELDASSAPRSCKSPEDTKPARMSILTSLHFMMAYVIIAEPVCYARMDSRNQCLNPFKASCSKHTGLGSARAARAVIMCVPKRGNLMTTSTNLNERVVTQW